MNIKGKQRLIFESPVAECRGQPVEISRLEMEACLDDRVKNGSGNLMINFLIYSLNVFGDSRDISVSAMVISRSRAWKYLASAQMSFF